MLNIGDKVLCVCNITLSFEDCIDYSEIAFVTQNSEIVKLKR